MSKFGNKTKLAATTTGKGPKNVTLFDVRVVETKNGKKTKVQFQKGVTISYNGTPVNLGEYNSAFLKDKEEMENDLAFLVEKEYMTEEQANEKADFITEKGIAYELKVANPTLQA